MAKSLLRSAVTVGGFTMISRVLGFARDILIAAFLGAGPAADAFFVAFKIPNLLRRLFAEGAFNAAFVPSFSALLVQEGRQAARAFAEDTLAVLATVLIAIVIAAEIFMPSVMVVLAPGFSDDPEKFALAVELTRLTFPYILFISLVALMGGILNSLDSFAAPAATPIVLNLCLIGAMLLLGDVAGTPAHALAWGVAIAGAGQFLWLAFSCRLAGLSLGFPVPRLTPRVRAMLILMGPAALGAGVAQINVLIDTMLATLLPTGSVSYLYYADRLVQLPLGVVGVALGTALLPRLSRNIGADDETAAQYDQNRAMEAGLLLSLPAAAALIAIGPEIVSVLFQRGAFDAEQARATASALSAYALGLPAYVLLKVLAPAYFARHDTRTPVRVAALCLVVNAVLAFALMQVFAHVGIALASAVASWLNATLLAVGLLRSGRYRMDARFRRRLPRMAISALAMAAVLWLSARLLAGPLAAGEIAGALSLAVIVVLGIAVFVAAALASGAAAKSDLAMLRRMKQS